MWPHGTRPRRQPGPPGGSCRASLTEEGNCIVRHRDSGEAWGGPQDWLLKVQAPRASECGVPWSRHFPMGSQGIPRVCGWGKTGSSQVLEWGGLETETGPSQRGVEYSGVRVSWGFERITPSPQLGRSRLEEVEGGSPQGRWMRRRCPSAPGQSTCTAPLHL